MYADCSSWKQDNPPAITFISNGLIRLKFEWNLQIQIGMTTSVRFILIFFRPSLVGGWNWITNRVNNKKYKQYNLNYYFYKRSMSVREIIILRQSKIG
ncbi:hypothetical protein ENKO_187 [Klebsiella phage fENko-Kae01]|nr:hypothetical protein 7t3_0351 [Salmonella phage 7t3]